VTVTLGTGSSQFEKIPPT